jgi:hypothetical protein
MWAPSNLKLGTAFRGVEQNAASPPRPVDTDDAHRMPVIKPNTLRFSIVSHHLQSPIQNYFF